MYAIRSYYDSDVDIMIRPTDREIERQLDPIRIPVDRGILGWRIAVIRQQDKGRFSAIRTEDEIRQFTRITSYNVCYTKLLRGFSEAAFAGALGVKLGGPNIYHGMMVHKPFIGEGFGEVIPEHIRRACDIMVLAAIIWLVVAWITSLF